MKISQYIGGVMVVFVAIAPLSKAALLNRKEQTNDKQSSGTPGLYAAGDDIELLTVHNFDKEIMGAAHVWLVEFYNSWCGFCQRFAPSWKALGTDVKGWTDMVKIGAIDCSDDANNPICRQYDIMEYPTLRYFHEHYRPGARLLGTNVIKGADVTSHRVNLLQQLIVEQNEGRAMMLPNLREYNYSDINNIFSLAPARVQYVFLIVENDDRLLGAALAMDFHKIPEVAVMYSINSSLALAHNYNIQKFPAVIVANRGVGYKYLQANLNSREGLRDFIKAYLQYKNIHVELVTAKDEIFTGRWADAEAPDVNVFMQQKVNQALIETVKNYGDAVYQMDLETTLRYSLKHEVANERKMFGEKLKALTSYINVLRKYFPFGERGRMFLDDLAAHVNSTAPINGEDLLAIVKRADSGPSEVYSTPQDWLGCRGSTPSHRGYPCGVWKLFHYLTVNAAIQNEHNAMANPVEVLHAMYGYIKHFFGCADCSRHFQEMAIQREINSVPNTDSAILWLWMAHNQVNQRLAGDETEDPEYPKRQFPSVERCPQCRKTDGTWNFAEVLRYLKNMYSSTKVKHIGSNTNILLHNEWERTTSGASSVFKSLDMSMCFILYVSSFLLLTVLIRLFLKRGYRKKPYIHDLLGKV